MNQPMRIVISAHSSHRQIAENLRNLFLNQKFLTFNIDETSPKNLSARANLIRWCDIFVVFVARCYHRTFNCMEALNYAKDVRRPILSLLVEPNFRAYGALGAIAASSISSFVIDDEHQLANIETQMINSILSRAKDRKPARNVKQPSEVCFSFKRRRTNRSEMEISICFSFGKRFPTTTSQFSSLEEIKNQQF